MKKAYISNIEVFGFKSYGERRLSIPFSDGFNAIVGPNGAGKSNIGDSIAFCLGLASTKALRASKLTDLIFSSKSGTVPFAEVEITFQNDGAFPVNSQEVRIYRKIDLNGKSTFKINSRPVKQKDVQDLLVEANIYPEGYNIITQGDIYRFVQMTPSERRDLISEIADIAEYEEKKQKAILELSVTQEKISQVRLILKEIQATLKKLEEEKESALLAQKLEEKIEELKRSINGVKLNNLLKELDKTSQDLQKIEEDIQSLYRRKEEIANLQKDCYIQIKESEDRLQEINQMFLPFKQKEGSITAQINQKNQEIDSLEGEIKRLQEQMKLLEVEKQEKLKELVQTREAIQDLHKDLPKLNLLIQEKERQVEEKNRLIRELEETQGKSKDDLINLENIQRKLKEALSHKEKERADLSIQSNSINEKIENLKEEVRRLELEILDQEKQLQTISSNSENFQLRITSLNSELLRYRIRKESQERKLKEIQQRIQENFKNLASVLAQLSQFKDDKIAVMLKGIEGVYGQVSDLISLKDERFQTAVEVAAGGRLKNIVVENEEVARRCIEIIKREKLGRTVFIPLNTIKFTEPPRLPSRRGILSYAIDFVLYDKKVEKAIKYVFGDTVIVESFNDAKVIGIGIYRMVTLDGELFEKSGIISGGSDRQTVAIGRGYLENKRAVLEREEERLKKEEESLELDIKSLNQSIKDIEAQVNNILTDSKTYDYRINEIKTQISQKISRNQSLQQQVLELNRKKFEIENRLSQIQRDIESLQKEYEEVSNRKSNLLSKIENSGFLALRREWEKETSEYYSLKQRLKDLESNISRLEGKISDGLQPRLDEIDKLIDQTKWKIEEITEKKQQMKQQIKELSEELSNLWKEMKDKEGSRDNLLNLIQTKKEEIRKLRYEEDQINRQITLSLEDKGKFTQRVLDLQEEVSTLRLEYDGEPIEGDLKRLELQLREVERARRELGGVNQRAVEDYQQTLERYREIEEKLEILLKEKKSIDELIQTLEEKKVSAFMDVYNKIDRNLGKNFRVLSSGGKAYLEIENPSNPLSGGIFIKVKPRGKDITRLELMSGGEKAITALAFLFAVLSLKPAPFYYLDEVDAALDESNVRKVAQLIKELSKHTQFIAVTHKETMASFADTLIGVSAKNGISSIYTLNISELREER